MTWHHQVKGNRAVCGKCVRAIQPGEDYAITASLLVRCEACAEKLNVPGPRKYAPDVVIPKAPANTSQPFSSTRKLAADFKVKQSGD